MELRIAHQVVGWLKPMSEIVRLLRAFGYQGIEGFGLTELLPEDVRLAEDLKACGMSYVGTFVGASLVEKDRFNQEKRDFEISVCETARLGGKVIVVGAGRIRQTTVEDDRKRLYDNAHVLAEIARNQGVVLAWHPHHHTLIFHPHEIEDFMHQSDPGLVGLALDTAHLHIGGVESDALAAFFEKWIARIRHVHLKDVQGTDKFVQLGSGKIPFGEILRVLLAADYDGWFVVELDSSPNPNITARESFEYLRGELTRIRAPVRPASPIRVS